tara:strand:+ start:1009 stop:1674 length:666 start_codon:yes stop_codon:yes gene_type:complete
MSEPLALLSSRAQQWAVAFTFMDPAAKVELLCLLSFTVCILGSLAEFPVALNLGVALLGLLSSRSGSEAQMLAFCLFVVMTTVTDVIFMTSRPSGWGGFMIVLNLCCKLTAATQSYRLAESSQALATDELGPDPMEQGGHVPVSHESLAAPLAREDYQALASEAAGACDLASASPPTPTPLALPARASELAPTPCAAEKHALGNVGLASNPSGATQSYRPI